jgi:DNA-binding transcriptional LysR family regulator
MGQSGRLNLNLLQTFYWVAKLEGFTAASRRLALPKSNVSEQIRKLEEHVGVRLIQRTTRRLSLTESGRKLYVHCERVLVEAERAEQAMGEAATEPHGLLRVGIPATFARTFLSPVLPGFCRKYPRIKLEFVIPGGRVDPIENVLDLVIRIGPAEDSSYVIRKLGSIARALYASAGYLERMPMPLTPEDLARHNIITTGRTPEGASWNLRSRMGAQCEAKFVPMVAVPDPTLCNQLAIDGVGIAIVPEFLVRDQPALVRILPEWTPPSVDVFALFPQRKLIPLKLRVFLDELENNLKF